MTFEGHVQITIEALESTSKIYLNVANLTIKEDSVIIEPVDEETPNPGIQDWEVLDDLQLMRINLQNSAIRGGIYLIRISFKGIISPSDQDHGLFWDQYPQHNEMRYVMGSQLQPVYARRVFPCFDEPTYKATFSVTIVRKMHMTSLACGDLIKSELREDGCIADSFHTTPIMSTYLLAFAIVDYPHLQIISHKGYKIRVWARADVIHAAEYAMTIAAPLVEWLDDYTGIQNPVTKIDKVAFPTWGGAMENWGLVLYSENLLLWDPTWFETDQQLLISNVVTHELTHYWFGNLVSCRWWDELWLNEGFASYFESMALQDPLGWPGSEIVLNSRLVPMMGVDEMNTSTPVRPHIPTPWHAEDAFSTSTYGKGAFMLRMIHQVLGPTSFQKALRKYLNDYAFSTTVSNDLWAVFNQVAVEDNILGPGGLPVNFTELFTPWIDQSGYPLLKMHRDYETFRVTYAQERYNSSDLSLPPSTYE
ncbi:hypothetical protein CAPTEDRAFT_195051 [Capitella teleta]|uniref:Uncharacterized protein n=1 Tax=Capitella teleta TaxID=283909 RepID=R7UIJ8_CAPTE|nr:hypothetical protein CAPTEDRAFT_195051 [Capitella teleta]|eukprot:ELU05923.1 hypothetical protein CAPTEDRAFT_195051 [Capitella teleta]